jgi:hypothetical protein
MKAAKSNNVLDKLKAMLTVKKSPSSASIQTNSDAEKPVSQQQLPQQRIELTVLASSHNSTLQIEQQNDNTPDPETESSCDYDTTCSMHDLPLEIICKIFDYMDYSEAKNASLVCKRWRNAHLESQLMRSVVMKANNSLFVSYRPASAINSNNSSLAKHRSANTMALNTYTSTFNFLLFRNLVNLEFDNDSADIGLLMSNLKSNAIASGEHMLPKLRSLKIVKTTLSAKSLVELVNEAPKLRSLSLIQCDSLFMSGFLAYTGSGALSLCLRGLEELSLSRNRYLSDFLLSFFVGDALSATSVAATLVRLDISHCYLTRRSFKSMVTSGHGGAVVPNANSNVVFTIEHLLKTVESLRALRSIDLSGVELLGHDEDALLTLVERAVCLEEIGLANLPALRVDTVNKLFEKKANQLRRVDLNNSVQVGLY